MYQWTKLKIQFTTDMNERLTELYRSCRTKEALASQDSFKSADVLIGSEVEKFAKLIVEECADVGSKFSQAHPDDISFQIKKHFGLKE